MSLGKHTIRCAAKKEKTSGTEVSEVLVGANGLEPLTPCTSSRCSSQLS